MGGVRSDGPDRPRPAGGHARPDANNGRSDADTGNGNGNGNGDGNGNNRGEGNDD